MRSFLLILAILPVAAFGATTASCPVSLPADALTVRAPGGWTGYSPSTMRLSYAGMMAGPPDSFSYLVPYKQTKTA